MGLLLRLKAFSDRLFTRHLLITNTVVGVVFVGAGDSIQQALEKRIYPEKKFDTKRTRNMMTVGVGFGFLAHFWYRFLDTKFPGKHTITICKKLLAEAVVGPPFCLGFFLSVGFLENKPAKTSFNDFKKGFFLICLADWGIYLPFQALNFYFLPPKYRVLYVCSLTLVYDIFLSYILHREDNKRTIELKNT